MLDEASIVRSKLGEEHPVYKATLSALASFTRLLICGTTTTPH